MTQTVCLPVFFFADDLDEGEDDGSEEYKKAKAAREKKEADLRKLRSEGKVCPLFFLLSPNLLLPAFSSLCAAFRVSSGWLLALFLAILCAGLSTGVAASRCHRPGPSMSPHCCVVFLLRRTC